MKTDDTEVGTPGLCSKPVRVPLHLYFLYTCSPCSPAHVPIVIILHTLDDDCRSHCQKRTTYSMKSTVYGHRRSGRYCSQYIHFLTIKSIVQDELFRYPRLGSKRIMLMCVQSLKQIVSPSGDMCAFSVEYGRGFLSRRLSYEV